MGRIVVVMPEIMDAMPSPSGIMGRPVKYNWPEIFDGQVHRFAEGEVPGTLSDFGRQVRAMAKRYHVTVSVVTRKGHGVYIQSGQTGACPTCHGTGRAADNPANEGAQHGGMHGV